MPDFGRHIRLESENRGWILAVAAVFIVSSAWVTLVAQSNASHRLITDSAGDTLATNTRFMPQLYEVTYLLKETNFIGDETQADMTYTAQSSMHLDVVQPTQALKFNSLNLDITNFSYLLDDWMDVCLCGYQYQCMSHDCKEMVRPDGSEGAREGTMVVLLFTPVQAGQHLVVHMEYTASLVSGLARSTAFEYADPVTSQMESQVLIAASLEPFGARRMLPCMDFPNLKANFSISIQAPDDLVALSTMAEESSQPGLEPGTTLHKFGVTPKMSTYLMGVTVGHMVSSSAMSDSGKKISVWSVPTLADQHAVPLQAALQGTNFYESYTGIELPLTKLDMMAIPGKGGAVENWGLIQFDERRMLVNEATEGAYGRWSSADVVCHELSHQWFGNYVTCKDFDNISVNEGLASFVEYKCIAAAFPEMSGQALFQRATTPHGENVGVHEGPRSHAMGVDATPFVEPLLTFRALSFLSYHPELPYSKGASLWRMLEAFWDSAGQDAFRAGLRVLMQRHALGSATLENVLTALVDGVAAVSGNDDTGDMQQLRANSRLLTVPAQTAVALLQFWIDQPGFPLINVSDSGTQAAQSRFYAWGSNVTDDPFVTSGNSTWYVPLGAGQLGSQAVPGDAAAQWGELLDHSGMIPSVDTEGTILNVAGTGYYRVQYPSAHQQQLTAALRDLTSADNSTMSVLLQANAFISDITALSFANSIDPSAILDTAAAVAASPACQTGFGMHLLVMPIVEALQQLALFSHVVEADNQCRLDLYTSIQQLLGSFAQPIVDQVSQQGASTADSKYDSATYTASQNTFLYDHVKGNILLAAAFHGDAPAADLLCKLYTDSLEAGAAIIDPDLRGAAYQAAVAGIGGCSPGAPLAWNAMLSKWQTDADIQEADRGLYALPWASTDALLQQTLDISLANEKVSSRSPSNSLSAVMRNVGTNPGSGASRGADVAWQWVQDNFVEAGISQMLAVLESFPFIPSQQSLDSLSTFLTPMTGLPQRVSELEALGVRSASVLQLTILAGSEQLTRQHMKAITASDPSPG
ncbi:hypothetical protein WJX77_012027 [Trebouxia sp. C0004]